MKEASNGKEYISEFVVKIRQESTLNAVRDKLEKGKLIQFYGTEKLNLYLGCLGHDEMRFKNEIQWSDIVADGYFKILNGSTFINYCSRPQENVKEAVRRAITKFLESLFQNS